MICVLVLNYRLVIWVVFKYRLVICVLVLNYRLVIWVVSNYRLVIWF